jgi:hypothetical protein
MYRRVVLLTLAVAGILGILAGCSNSLGERRAAWRNTEERACTIRRHVRPNAYIERVGKVKAPGACGIIKPLKVSALTGGRVAVGPSATINCPMTAALENWMTATVQPAALAWFGQPVAEIKQLGSYVCRRRNNERQAKLSEHAFGNALDIAGFRLADGREITVRGDWRGEVNARSFLREAFAGACDRFKTVLGPGVRNHADHFHLDLAHHNNAGTSRYCRPQPDTSQPRRAPYRPGLFAQDRVVDQLQTGSVGGASNVTSYAPVPEWRPMPPALD